MSKAPYISPIVYPMKDTWGLVLNTRYNSIIKAYDHHYYMAVYYKRI